MMDHAVVVTASAATEKATAASAVSISSLETIRVMRRQEDSPAYRVVDYLSQIPSSAFLAVDADCRSAMMKWCYQVADACSYDRETVSIAMSCLDRFLGSSSTSSTTTTTTTTTTNKGTVKLLPDAALVARSLDDFGPYDILCGRCKQAFNNCGNRRFRITISLFLKKYLAAKSRTDKSELIISIVRYLRGPVGVRFLKPIKGPFEGYVEIGESGAREKVGHALRDLTVTVHHTTIAELREAESKARPPVLIPRKKKKQKTVRFQSYDDQGSTESNKLDQDKDEEEAQSTETEAEELSTDKEEDERQSPVRGDGEDPDTENKEEEPQSPVRADEAESSSMESNQYDYYDCQEKEGGHEVRHEIRYKEPSKPAHDDDDPELYEATLSLFLATYGNRRQTFTM